MKGCRATPRDGRFIHAEVRDPVHRPGLWAIPIAGGAPRLVIAADDPDLISTGWVSVGPDSLYLTVGQYESDIWVASLRW